MVKQKNAGTNAYAMNLYRKRVIEKSDQDINITKLVDSLKYSLIDTLRRFAYTPCLLRSKLTNA
jgi:hypothetical protein